MSLDMTATKNNEYEEHIINYGNENILPVSVIYGANASGKSNVIEAFKYMTNYVINSLNYSFDLGNKPNCFLKPIPFSFDNESKNSESLFEIYYIDPKDKNERTINYGFTINQTGIVEEWLNIKAKTARKPRKVFYRNSLTNLLDIKGINSKIIENLRVSLEKETLLVSLGARLKVELFKNIQDWFINNEFTNFGETFENYYLSNLIPDNFQNDEKVRKNVIKYLSTFDDSIVDFVVQKVPGDKPENDRFHIDTIHKMIDGKNYASIPLQYESEGTKKMFSLYQWLQNILESGGVLLIDELNSKLHPLLVRAFVQIFLNQDMNSKHAQLIFTTHDTWQMNSKLFRRDEIWFTEKDKNGLSELYSLADFVDNDGNKIRKDENYEKNYLLGKYGAIPTLKCFDLTEDSSEEIFKRRK